MNRNDFNLKKTAFDHQSLLHGIPHTYRVMCNVLVLGSRLGYDRECRLAFFAAYVHDMARRHDGYCSDHGTWAAENKLSMYTDMFTRHGFMDGELPEITTALINHCQRFDYDKDHPHYTTTALLKDADALDRIRLGPGNLKPELLRFDLSRKLVPVANAFYFASLLLRKRNFDDFLRLALRKYSLKAGELKVF